MQSGDTGWEMIHNNKKMSCRYVCNKVLMEIIYICIYKTTLCSVSVFSGLQQTQIKGLISVQRAVSQSQEQAVSTACVANFTTRSDFCSLICALAVCQNQTEFVSH